MWHVHTAYPEKKNTKPQKTLSKIPHFPLLIMEISPDPVSRISWKHRQAFLPTSLTVPFEGNHCLNIRGKLFLMGKTRKLNRGGFVSGAVFISWVFLQCNSFQNRAAKNSLLQLSINQGWRERRNSPRVWYASVWAIAPLSHAGKQLHSLN